MTVDPNVAAGALLGLLGGTALLGLLYGPWQRLCTDYARDVIFQQRDALFDIGASGRLSFGCEPYETIRSSLNALIRLAHRLTLFEMVVFALMSRRSRLHLPRSDVRTALGLIADGCTRDEVSRLVAKAEVAALVMVLLRSPGCVFFVILPFTLVTALRRGLRGALERGKRVLTGQIENAITVEARSPAT